jgi:hypothetical protein
MKFFFHMTGHACIHNLLSMLLLPASDPVFVKPLIDLFPKALSKDLIFRLGFPALCGIIF